MKVAVFSNKPYDQASFSRANSRHEHDLHFLEARLNIDTVALASDYPAICAFVNDDLSIPVLNVLHEHGTRLVVLRCAGFNNVDLHHADKIGMTVMRVPAYSPYAVAEHTLGLIMSLNRGIHRAYNRVRDGNFSLNGLLGFDLHGCTVGIIGTGRIGRIFAGIMQGLGCHIVAYDPYPDVGAKEMGLEYVTPAELYQRSDIISMHCPLNPDTFHLIDSEAIAQMKKGVMLVNTSRGGVIDTTAVISGLKTGQVGYLGIDVYEQEGDLFFEDLSNKIIQDDVFERLLTFPNVLVTGHQGYFTQEALDNIAETTLSNIDCFENNMACGFKLNPEYVVHGK
ncbi:MAG: 2-hydroxyacid dehydrogenase [Gammaproteobacteria bacterium]|nr:2-hydroxyacid dehydrogenase [Gammaproteobacteria bacterium]